MLNIMGLKSRNLITVPLDIPQVAVLSVNRNERSDMMVTVESTQVGTLCQHCGQPITQLHSHDRGIKLRHLSILGQRTYIRMQPQRYACASCAGKTTTQTLDWYEAKSPHTKAYDCYLMLQLINSTVEDVSRKEAVGYDAVEGALARRIQVQVNWNEFAELGIIGIDEIALTKGRGNFVAIITTQQADGHVALLAVLERVLEVILHFHRYTAG